MKRVSWAVIIKDRQGRERDTRLPLHAPSPLPPLEREDVKPAPKSERGVCVVDLTVDYSI